jgi:NtrC-family two-component system sensor histidine kinase KinB
VTALQARAAERRTTLTSEATADLPAVGGGPARHVRGLTNHIDNAIRYTEPGGHVIVSADQVGRFVQFSVADDGPGIPLEHQSRIFDKFVQLPRPGAVGGTGLGLAIAREIVRAHGGAIWVDSGPGPGSVFSFTVPVSTSSEPGTPPALAAPPGAFTNTHEETAHAAADHPRRR